MIRILLLEDEKLAAKAIIQKLGELSSDYQVVAQIASVAEARQWLLHSPPPDLILADIQLADGISFELFETYHVEIPIIFITAFDEYAIRAFKLNSIDYLLKPVEKQDLKLALDKYQGRQQLPAYFSEVIKQLASLGGKPLPSFKERFLALSRNTLVPIHIDQIAYFKKDSLIYIHTFDQKRYISEIDTMEEIEELVDPAIFYRANRQYFLHINSVGTIQQTQKGLLVSLNLPNAEPITISREKTANFKKWIVR